MRVKPEPLPARQKREPDGWWIAEGRVVQLQGPYVLSGGWWHKPVERAYHFAQLHSGAVAWVFFDVCSKRWLLHGWVE